MKKIFLLLMILSVSLLAQPSSLDKWKVASNVLSPVNSAWQTIQLGSGGLRFNSGQIQYSANMSSWTAIPTTVGAAGGWTLGSSKVYPTTANNKVHIRVSAGDTTGTSLFNVYGSAAVSGNVTVNGTVSALSLALGGATIGSNALAVTGTSLLGGALNIGNPSTGAGDYLTTLSTSGTQWQMKFARTSSPYAGSMYIGADYSGLHIGDGASTDYIIISKPSVYNYIGFNLPATFSGSVSALSLALGGATIGSNALAVTGTSLLNGNVTLGFTIGAGTGALYAGAGTFSGAVAIGNTVNTVSPTSPNRTITMVVGGVTYYLFAKTTND